MAILNASVQGWVAIGISVVAILVTWFWNRRIGHHAKRSADAAEESAKHGKRSADAAQTMADLKKNSYLSQNAPAIQFDTFERTKLRICNSWDRSVRLLSLSWAGGGIHECLNALDVLLEKGRNHDYELPSWLRDTARKEGRDLLGWVIVDDLRGRKWKQGWGFAQNGHKAWATRIEELPSENG